jgi:putative ABC transport system permease protein
VNGSFGGWRASIRIARRDAWRFKGRSSLVLAMIALPIMGVSATDVMIRSSDLTTEQNLTRELGAADARLEDGGGVPIYQGLEDYQYTAVDEKAPPATKPTDIPAAMPAGAKWLRDSLGSAKVETTQGLLDAEVRELKAADPIAKGIMTLQDGRFPAGGDEVAATSYFLEQSGLHVGSRLTVRNLSRQYTIVGAYELPSALKTAQLNAQPGAVLAPLTKALTKLGRSAPETSASYLVGVRGGFSWKMVMTANTKGVVVASREVRLHPPAHSEVPLYVKRPQYAESYGSGSAQAAVLGAGATIGGLAMLEICLLAGPAFAVGARRSRRQLGLVGANGGDRRHIRAIVLSGGLVIGAVAAVAGTALGLGLGVVLRPWMEGYLGKRFGGIEVRPLELAGIALLAVVTGLLAAVVPAVVASRESVLVSLTGRRGIRRANRVLPVLGLAAVALGAGIAVFGSALSDSALVVAGGSAIAELGVVALTPVLVGFFGRVGKWLPLSPRLALRDAVRNRGRTAPAVAAVLAAVAGTVAVATYQSSTDQEAREGYMASLPYGGVAVTVGVDGVRALGGVRSAVEKDFPVTARADLDRIVVGKKTCDVYESAAGCGSARLVTPKANECGLYAADSGKLTPAEVAKWRKDWRCANSDYSPAVSIDSGVLVADASVLKTLGVKDPAAAAALARGEAVAFNRRNVENGRITLELIPDSSAEPPVGQEWTGSKKSFPVHSVFSVGNSFGLYGIYAIIPPATAKAAGLRTVGYGSLFSTKRLPSSAESQKLDAALANLGVQADTKVERGYVSDSSSILLILSIFAGLVTIGAAGIATGLAQADAEPDLKTLAAVGAAPRVRRTLSGFQCGVVAAMGVVLGSAAGIVPAIGLRKSEQHSRMKYYRDALAHGLTAELPHVPIVLPWGTLAALLVAVPVGAALLAALVTRSRTAMMRRAEG